MNEHSVSCIIRVAVTRERRGFFNHDSLITTGQVHPLLQERTAQAAQPV